MIVMEHNNKAKQGLGSICLHREKPCLDLNVHATHPAIAGKDVLDVFVKASLDEYYEKHNPGGKSSFKRDCISEGLSYVYTRFDEKGNVLGTVRIIPDLKHQNINHQSYQMEFSQLGENTPTRHRMWYALSLDPYLSRTKFHRH